MARYALHPHNYDAASREFQAPLTERSRWEATFDEPVRGYQRPVERRTNAPISQAIPPTASSAGT
jgi:hypothetical protein